ncbi:hypothetical protein K504DRAFT_475010 [Pleomassaria siparia CBS 279.74]|uniref:tRNA(Phe) 7-[(3-amino-3-carboxypropyl)-4-demethylwyosine(37)-N(4)]-methyltransferase n=1 Tax=Pleomassaria siparia CBS 279.74 TaxID=1314801 RepID=A0A6G1KIR0_9PLEO|nr:hypothetical protein K504DRAFT_475010 [Pleomassaria siparia CBS 279.74]
MQSRFKVKKRKILEQLDTPDVDYQDLSPKGSIDTPIRPLISDINGISGLVTTSSCSGRISVFLEGRKKEAHDAELPSETDVSRAGPGGKGGGAWLFISHDPVDFSEHPHFMSSFGLQSSDAGKEMAPNDSCRYIHLKFEPMVCTTTTLTVIVAAMSAGLRESGAVGLSTPKMGDLNPMVAVRSTGYSFDAIIGYQDENDNNIALVDEAYLSILVRIANDRFKVNTERIARFRAALLEQYSEAMTVSALKPEWEDPEIRRHRKREEGLARQRELASSQTASDT